MTVSGFQVDSPYVLDVVDKAVAGGLGTNEASTPVHALTSKHAYELILELFVSTEQETNLPGAGPDVTSYKRQERSAEKTIETN